MCWIRWIWFIEVKKCKPKFVLNQIYLVRDVNIWIAQDIFILEVSHITWEKQNELGFKKLLVQIRPSDRILGDCFKIFISCLEKGNIEGLSVFCFGFKSSNSNRENIGFVRAWQDFF